MVVELYKHVAGVGTWRYLPLCLKSSGGVLRVRGRGGVEVWRCGGVEVRCRRANVEVFASRDLELVGHAAGPGT